MLLARCERCGTAVTVGPVGAGLHDAGAYADQAPRGSGLAAPVLSAFDRRRLRILRRALPAPARLLDAGAGRGRFVAAARDAGYDAQGIEPAAARAAAARDLYGVELCPVGIQDAEFGPGSFDGVSLWHVLEHLDDPAAALETVVRWLRPGGVLLIGVPNLGSLQARVGGPRWYHLDLPRHRTHFTVSGLHGLLRAHGVEPERTYHVLAEHNQFGMWQSVVNRATRRPSYLFNLLKRNAPAASPDLAITALAVPLAPIAALAELGAGLARRGGTVAVVARRAGA